MGKEENKWSQIQQPTTYETKPNNTTKSYIPILSKQNFDKFKKRSTIVL